MRFFNILLAHRRDAAWLLGLVIGSLFLYAQSLDFSFVHFDDQTILTDHPDRYDETSFTKSARTIFLTDFPREEPLVVRDLSWALDARLFGFSNARAYHRTNIILNALSNYNKCSFKSQFDLKNFPYQKHLKHRDSFPIA